MKKILALLLAVIMVLSMAACGTQAPSVEKAPAATEATPAATEATEAIKETEAAGPRVIVDALGREVEIPAEVNRIVAMGDTEAIVDICQAIDKFMK